MQFQSTNSLTVNSLKIMVYGRTGSQKTRLITTCPNPVVISTDKGLISIKDHNIPFVEVNGYDDFIKKFNDLMSCPEMDHFQTIVLDDVSELSKMIVREELAKKSNSGKKVNGQQAYGAMQEKMEAICNNFIDIPNKNVLVIAKQKTYNDDETGTTVIGPSFEGKQLWSYIPYKFDFLFRAYTVDDANQPFPVPQLQTSQLGNYDAKCRIGQLPQIVYGDLNAIFNTVLAQAN